jgi:ferredoxin-NADP reductase
VVLTLERHHVEFVPGQCFNLGLSSLAINREYSSYSGIKEDHLQFLIREVDGGELSPRLASLKPGDSVEVDGGYGLFVLEPSRIRHQKYIFIGTGTGIAPFHSFVRSYPDLDYLVIHGTREPDESYDREHYAKDRYVHCVSKGQGGDVHGRVTDYLAEIVLPEQAFFYLCGNRHMINDAFDLLSRRGVSSSHIVTEVFF